MDDAQKSGKPFFIWHNTTRCASSRSCPEVPGDDELQTNYGLEEAGIEADGRLHRRACMKRLDDIGEADNTLIVFSTDNGAEVFTWPDGGMTPFKATKGTRHGRRLPRAVHRPLARQDQAGTVRERTLLRSRLVPHHGRRRRQSEHHRRTAERVKLGDRTYKNHLDGYNQFDLLLDKGPSKREELFYFGGPHLGAVRIGDLKYQFYQQPQGWPGPKVTTDMPTIVNIRQIPSNERRRSVSRA